VLDARGHGALPPLLMLHGFSSSGVHYAPLLPRMRRRVRRILLPDFPGHGRSEVPAAGVSAETVRDGLFEALDTLIDEPVVAFGNSMGGFAAIRYAAARPDKVCGLFVVSPSGAPMPPGEVDAFRASFDLRSHADALRFVDDLFAHRVLMRQFLAWGVRQKFARAEHRALLTSLSREHFLAPEELQGLRMPVLLMWGRSDRILPRASLAFFRAHLPRHARVERPEGVGHSPFLESPGALARRIVAFLWEVRGQPAVRMPRLVPAAHGERG